MTPLRWTLAAGGAVLLSAALGAAAAALRDDGAPLVTFGVFAATTLPVALGLMYVVLTDERPPEHHEDSVESEWMQRAASGAFVDLVVVLGIATAIASVLDAPPLDPVLFLVLALLDAGLRFAVLRRRAA